MTEREGCLKQLETLTCLVLLAGLIMCENYCFFSMVEYNKKMKVRQQDREFMQDNPKTGASGDYTNSVPRIGNSYGGKGDCTNVRVLGAEDFSLTQPATRPYK